jgi:hypothetical protein
VLPVEPAISALTCGPRYGWRARGGASGGRVTWLLWKITYFKFSGIPPISSNLIAMSVLTDSEIESRAAAILAMIRGAGRATDRATKSGTNTTSPDNAR